MRCVLVRAYGCIYARACARAHACLRGCGRVCRRCVCEGMQGRGRKEAEELRDECALRVPEATACAGLAFLSCALRMASEQCDLCWTSCSSSALSPPLQHAHNAARAGPGPFPFRGSQLSPLASLPHPSLLPGRSPTRSKGGRRRPGKPRLSQPQGWTQEGEKHLHLPNPTGR